MTTRGFASARLLVLGPASVRRADSSHAGSLLTQPRRVAVLAYLALARPRGLHARDTLVTLLWPEADQIQGRHALRNALHSIRRALGDRVIVRAGDGLVAVDPRLLACDALEMEVDLAEDRPDDALARYEGELLQGFHVSDAPGFERWLDVERQEFAEAAATAAGTSAERKLEAGDLTGAIRQARRACALAGDDERALRRLLRILVAAGDRASAARTYESFADRVRAEYDVSPSPETRAMMAPLRGEGCLTRASS